MNDPKDISSCVNRKRQTVGDLIYLKCPLNCDFLEHPCIPNICYSEHPFRSISRGALLRHWKSEEERGVFPTCPVCKKELGVNSGKRTLDGDEIHRADTSVRDCEFIGGVVASFQEFEKYSGQEVGGRHPYEYDEGIVLFTGGDIFAIPLNESEKSGGSPQVIPLRTSVKSVDSKTIPTLGELLPSWDVILKGKDGSIPPMDMTEYAKRTRAVFKRYVKKDRECIENRINIVERFRTGGAWDCSETMKEISKLLHEDCDLLRDLKTFWCTTLVDFDKCILNTTTHTPHPAAQEPGCWGKNIRMLRMHGATNCTAVLYRISGPEKSFIKSRITKVQRIMDAPEIREVASHPISKGADFNFALLDTFWFLVQEKFEGHFP